MVKNSIIGLVLFLTAVLPSWASMETLKAQVAQAQKDIDFQYSDGDISRAEHKGAIHRLAEITEDIRAKADAQSGTLTSDQQIDFLTQLHEIDPSIAVPRARVGGDVMRVRAPQSEDESEASPESSDEIYTLNSVNDLLLQLRTLLDQKQKDGEITRVQADAQRSALERIDQQAQEESREQSGRLTADQADELVQRLHRSYYLITNNFITE